MRLWHKDLIGVLPRNQLLGQWRECCLIAKLISENGTPNHLLVNKIMDYPISDFVHFSQLVYREMISRNYKADWSNFIKYFQLYIGVPFWTFKDLFKEWNNDRYLTQCYYNLQEKYDCGGITEQEWEKINKRVKDISVIGDDDNV